jgi:hypothetical protein
VPACVQAHAWIALGKVCLVDEGLAKKVVPLFVQVSKSRGSCQWQLGQWLCSLCCLRVDMSHTFDTNSISNMQHSTGLQS